MAAGFSEGRDRASVCVVVAARPNLMKAAPILDAMGSVPELESRLVHTGQHYDYLMSQVFFEQLELPEPVVNLEVGGGTHHSQTGEVMKRFGEYVRETRPDCIMVLGDVNATAACALVAAKEHVLLAHVEAGLRSGDRRMPEEINRIVTDAVSDLLLVTEQSGLDNLAREGIAAERVVFTGNVMIDSLKRILPAARSSGLLDRLRLRGRRYVVMTLHRPSNVDENSRLAASLAAMARLSDVAPVVFPVHPRTAAQMQALGVSGIIALPEGGTVGERGVWTTPPAAYADFVALMEGAALVITDSGGVQEETTYLGVPCLTYRDSTERPSTVTLGTNRVVGTDPERLLEEAVKALGQGHPPYRVPPLWDGAAAKRIVTAVRDLLAGIRQSRAAAHIRG